MEIQSLVDSISKLTLIEASELVKALETKLGVSAAPVAAAAAFAFTCHGVFRSLKDLP